MQYAAEPMHGSTPRKQSDEIDADVDGAARSVIQAAAVRRVEAAELGVVQFTDDDIKREQDASVMVQSLLRKGAYRGQRVYRAEDGLVRVELEGGDRTILPVIYWALAFKEAHDSIWAGHLRGPPTLERLQRMYWWPRMREAVQSWVAACQDCGSRKAKPKAVVPPLRSVRTGDVCDRWAIDVAGPLPVTAGGNRYVIAAVEYTTRYAVATAVSEHTAKAIARFLMDKVVFVYGPMREIMMDGAMEFGSKATAELLELMQVKQSTPVPYRPKLLGLVERFHRTWKDIVSLYVDEGQDDWDDFLPSALYAYNSSRHSTHGFQPNELMMGRKLRTPAELLRRSRVAHPHSTLQEYHEILLQDLSKARELAAVALQKEQARQAMYYNQRNVRNGSEFRPGQLVWLYRPARGPGITKFGHRWRGPGKIIEATGYDNYLIQMLESGQELVTHCSFLLSYYYPTHLLEQMAKDIAADLREEAVAAADLDSDDEDGAETEMEAQDSDQNSPEAVGAAVVTSVATEPSHAATPRAATPERAEIAAAADEAAAHADSAQPESHEDAQSVLNQLQQQSTKIKGMMPWPTDPACARSAPEQLQQAPATLLPDGPVPRSERRPTQASGATVNETRAPAELMPDLQHLQQPTSPATKAKQPAESQLNATETKTKVAEASDGSSSSMSSSPADTALKTTKKKDPVLANTEPKDSKLIKTLLQRAMKRPLQRSSPEKPAVKLVKPDVQTASQRRQSPQPTKATKQNGSTYLPGVAGGEQTASWPDNRDWHASSPEKPWWNTAAEGLPQRLWINQQDYEKLWSEGRVRSERAEGKDSEDDEGSTRVAHDGAAQMLRTTAAAEQLDGQQRGTNRGRFGSMGRE
ncbi:hypothetical protein PR001_g27418 [Phytophthora rubi]|uniref:Integrase catalytic domain-containing protein n=1 Tax=Phytophthora rubi TaxID=129364 RepID=A0A6A3HLC9_9STRA|nr:hypothetical protein PR001_g27418 [Phytophthora rubi]